MNNKDALNLLRTLFQFEGDAPLEDMIMCIWDEVNDLKMENAKLTGKLETLNFVLSVKGY